jgi:hypothetical protein
MASLTVQLILFAAVIAALFAAIRGVSAASRRQGEKLRKQESGAITVLQPNLAPVFAVPGTALSVLLLWLLLRQLPKSGAAAARVVLYIILVNACVAAIGIASRRWKLVLEGETVQYQDWFGRRHDYRIRDIDECRVSRRGVYSYYSRGKKLFSMSGTDAGGDASMVMGTINSRKAIRYLTTFSIPIKMEADEKAARDWKEDGTVRAGQYLGILRITAAGTAAMAVRYAAATPVKPAGIAVYGAGCAVSIAALVYFKNDRTWFENRTICQKRWFTVHTYPFTQIRGAERTGDSLTFFGKTGRKLFSVSCKYDGYQAFEQEVRKHWRIKSLGQG